MGRITHLGSLQGKDSRTALKRLSQDLQRREVPHGFGYIDGPGGGTIEGSKSEVVQVDEQTLPAAMLVVATRGGFSLDWPGEPVTRIQEGDVFLLLPDYPAIHMPVGDSAITFLEFFDQIADTAEIKSSLTL